MVMKRTEKPLSPQHFRYDLKNLQELSGPAFRSMLKPIEHGKLKELLSEEYLPCQPVSEDRRRFRVLPISDRLLLHHLPVEVDLRGRDHAVLLGVIAGRKP